jgi:mRNA interferase HicA
MKRKELIKKLSSAGCVLIRHGARHDLYQNSNSGKKQPVPRHDDIDESLAKHILKELG